LVEDIELLTSRVRAASFDGDSALRTALTRLRDAIDDVLASPPRRRRA
jgi:hypothetical protein